MSWLSNLFGGGRNPADAAQGYLGQIPGAVNPYYQPYINAGQQSMGQTQGIYNQMTQNPNDYYNKIASGYKESPGYQFKLQQGLGAANNAAAAGGMAGSPEHQFQSAGIAEGFANQDFNDYLQNVLGINQTGLQGQENALGRGYNASTGYGDILGQLLGKQGQYAYAGQAGQNAQQGNNLSNILKLGSMFLPGIGGLTGSALPNFLSNRFYG